MKINKPHSRGVTLLELMIVVLIASIVTLTAIGSYSAMRQRRNLIGTAATLNSAMITARSYAVSRNAWHRLVIQFRNPGSQAEDYAWWIDEIPPNSNTTPNPTVPDPAVRAKLTTPQRPPAGIQFLDANVRGTTYTASANNYVVIRFQPDGSSDDAVVRLTEDSTVGNRAAPVAAVKLYAATAKSKVLKDVAP